MVAELLRNVKLFPSTTQTQTTTWQGQFFENGRAKTVNKSLGCSLSLSLILRNIPNIPEFTGPKSTVGTDDKESSAEKFIKEQVYENGFHLGRGIPT